MPVWAIVLIYFAVFGVCFCFFGIGMYFFEKSADVRYKSQLKPHEPPVVFEEVRMPPTAFMLLKKCRERGLFFYGGGGELIKQPPMPIDERTREELKKILQERNNMAVAQRERTADGEVIISKDEYREYTELKAKRDRSEASMRARMLEAIQAKTEFARKVAKLIEAAGLENLTALAGPFAEEVLDIANEILAEE